MHRSGDRLRVNITLVRVSDGATLWSQTFNTLFADVFAVEEEIATRRRSAPFTRFMAQLKPVWEEYVRKMQYTAPRAVAR
jgi:hypothetical protein